VAGRSASIFFTAEDRAKGLPERELRVASTEGRATDENWMVRKDGGRFWASGVTTALRDERGGLRGFVKILRDLTVRRRAEEALRESEHRLRVALSAAQMGTWHWDIAENRQSLDESLARLCGLGPAEQVRTLEDFLRTVHPDDRPDVAEAFDRSVIEGTNFDVEFRVVWPDGTVRWLKDQGDVFHDEAGRPLYMTGACVDITFRRRAEEELRRARDELERRVRERTAELEAANVSLQEQFAQRRELLRRLATAEEDERRRISRELHDEMGQYLTALILDLKLLGGDIPADSPARARLERLQQVTNQIGQEVHRLAVVLRPTALDDLGLPKTLRNHVEEWSARTGMRADFHASGLDARLPIDVETTLYRITQEALTNVAKHAEAGRVSVILEARDGEVTLIVEDDGHGFDAESVLERPGDVPQLGLLGMRERVAALGGTLTIESGPGGPTTLFARIPTPGDGERGRDGQ
jgi:PAS domain S-box-containing protein